MQNRIRYGSEHTAECYSACIVILNRVLHMIVALVEFSKIDVYCAFVYSYCRAKCSCKIICFVSLHARTGHV